jgi:NAD(P)H-dependent flavin oxidoreductase YrpB (nitropropane dioxygenase family)
MVFDTALTRMLGIRVPVVQGGLQWVAYAELAAAVSNAGGLGIINALTQPDADNLRAEIKKTRSLTDKPFGVNITLLPALNPPDYPSFVRVIIEEKIQIVETAGNSPGPVIRQLKAAGITVIHKATTVRHAKAAIKLGVDILSIDGFECAGHVGESDISSLILNSRARQELGNTPFIASGGFADGYGMMAALSLGAAGINMGTRFMATVESPIHINVKRAIVDSDEHQTTLILRRWKNTSRMYSNKMTAKAVEIESESEKGEFSEIAPVVSGAKGREVLVGGDIQQGVSIRLVHTNSMLTKPQVWYAGQVMGLIHDIPTCAELVARIESEANAVLSTLTKSVKGGQDLKSNL